MKQKWHEESQYNNKNFESNIQFELPNQNKETFTDYLKFRTA